MFLSTRGNGSSSHWRTLYRGRGPEFRCSFRRIFDLMEIQFWIPWYEWGEGGGGGREGMSMGGYVFCVRACFLVVLLC